MDEISRVYIKKSELLDTIILYLLLFQVLFLKWLGLQNLINNIVIILIAFAFLVDYNRVLKLPMIIGVLLFALYFPVNYILISGTTSNLYDNFMHIFKGLFIFVYLCDLLSNKRDFVVSFFDNKFWLFNIYMLINIPFLLLQLSGYYSLSALNYSTASSPYVVDYISGLFGLYGTPTLAIYSTFLFFYNYFYIETLRKGSLKRVTLLIYNYIILAFNLWISTKNDNKGFYLIFFVYLISVFMISQIRTSESINNIKNRSLTIQKSIFRLIPLVLVVFLIALVAYEYTPFQETVNTLMRDINRSFDFSNSRGSGERISMILFLLSTPSKWVFGYGLGKYRYNSVSLGFSHFGQADFGTFLCLGGFVIIFLLIFIIYKAAQRNFSSKFASIIVLIDYIILAIYTQIFANTSSTICSVFLLITMVMYSSDKDNKKGESALIEKSLQEEPDLKVINKYRNLNTIH